MTELSTTQPTRGIVPPIVTPLLDSDTLDLEGLKRLVEHLIEGDVAGIFILGSTGEAANISHRLRSELMKATCEFVAGRVPVWVGVTDPSTVETLNLANVAAKAGANAVVVTAPYYYNNTQPELVRYMRCIADASPLPILLYNMPCFTKAVVEVASIEQLTDHPNIIGVKDSGGDIEYFRELIALKEKRPDWTFMVGPDSVFAESMRLGGDGGVLGGANVYPKLFTTLFGALDNQDETLAETCFTAVETFNTMYGIDPLGSRIFMGMKCALALKGICNDAMTEPFAVLSEEQRKVVAGVVEKVDALGRPTA